MKRKQKRYETEAELIEAIDRTKTKLERLRTEAALEDNEDRLRKLNANCRRIEDATLPRLKNALAAFRTIPMPIISDPGVVA